MNSKDYSWNEMSLVVYGRTIEGLVSMKLEVEVEKEFLRGRGSKPLGIVSGNESVKGEIGLLQGEYEELLAAVQTVDAGLKVTDIEAEIIWLFERNNLITTAVIKGVQFTKYDKEMNQGDKKMEIKLPFMALAVIES